VQSDISDGVACAACGLMVATIKAAVRPVVSTAIFGTLIVFRNWIFKGPPWDPARVRERRLPARLLTCPSDCAVFF
jgi:hypothetical protein